MTSPNSNEDAKAGNEATAAALGGQSSQRNHGMPLSNRESMLLDSLMRGISANQHQSSVGFSINTLPSSPVPSSTAEGVSNVEQLFQQHLRQQPQQPFIVSLPASAFINHSSHNPSTTIPTLQSILQSRVAPIPGRVAGLSSTSYPFQQNTASVAPAQIYAAPAHAVQQPAQDDTLLAALLQNRALQGVGTLPVTNALQISATPQSSLLFEGTAARGTDGAGPLPSFLAGKRAAAEATPTTIGGFVPAPHITSLKVGDSKESQHNTDSSNNTTTPLVNQICRDYDSLTTKDVRRLPFPEKLMYMLEKEASKGNDHIISFVGDGTAVMIHKTKEFEQKTMPQYFASSKVTSFHRQLNIYDFERVEIGPFKGSYYNKHFKRGQKDMLRKIKRVEIKGSSRGTS